MPGTLPTHCYIDAWILLHKFYPVCSIKVLRIYIPLLWILLLPGLAMIIPGLQGNATASIFNISPKDVQNVIETVKEPEELTNCRRMGDINMDDMIEVRVVKDGVEQKERAFVEPGTVEEREKDLQQTGSLRLGQLVLRAQRQLQAGTLYSYHFRERGVFSFTGSRSIHGSCISMQRSTS